MAAGIVVYIKVFDTESAANTAGVIKENTFVLINKDSGNFRIGDGVHTYNDLDKKTCTTEIWQQWYEAANYSDCLLVTIPADSSVMPIGRSNLYELIKGGQVSVTYKTDLIGEGETPSEDTAYNSWAISSILANTISYPEDAINCYLTTDEYGIATWKEDGIHVPENTTAGQYLTSQNNGVPTWVNLNVLPEGGNVNDYLIKTSNGQEWRKGPPAPDAAYQKDYYLGVDSTGNYKFIPFSNEELPATTEADSILSADGDKNIRWISKSSFVKKDGDEMTGTLKLNGNADPLQAYFRNIFVGTSDIASVKDSMQVGEIYFQIEDTTTSTSTST